MTPRRVDRTMTSLLSSFRIKYVNVLLKYITNHYTYNYRYDRLMSFFHYLMYISTRKIMKHIKLRTVCKNLSTKVTTLINTSMNRMYLYQNFVSHFLLRRLISKENETR